MCVCVCVCVCVCARASICVCVSVTGLKVLDKRMVKSLTNMFMFDYEFFQAHRCIRGRKYTRVSVPVRHKEKGNPGGYGKV